MFLLVFAFSIPESTSSKLTPLATLPINSAITFLSERSLNGPERFITNTELFSISVVLSLDSTIPKIHTKPRSNVTNTKRNMPTKVAKTFLKKSFIKANILYVLF